MSEIKDILTQVSDGRLSVEEAVQRLKLQPFEDLGYAKVDLHRALRQLRARYDPVPLSCE